MTPKDIYALRKQGRIKEAYDSARQLYASDKGPSSSLVMFWTAVDMLRAHAVDNQEEAMRILLALERMLPNVPDREGHVKDAFEKCKKMLYKTDRNVCQNDNKPEHLKMGAWGEEMAVAYLRDKGYVIIDRDWRSGHRDIDIIARDNEYVVFVEVKTRRNSNFVNPEFAIDYKKRRNIRLAMSHYIKYRDIRCPVRFDIVTVIGSLSSTNLVINHMENVRII